MKTYKHNNRTYKYKSKKIGQYGIYHHTFYDGKKEMFVFESREFLSDGDVDRFIDRYIILVRKDKLDRINEIG